MDENKRMQRLILQLCSTDEDVKNFAMARLEKIGKPAVISLIDALKNDNARVRCSAIWALGNMGDVSAMPALIEALKDDDEEVRCWAARELGYIGNASAVPALIEALKDDSADVRMLAAWTLGDNMGVVSAVPALIEALKDDSIYFHAAESLERILSFCESPKELQEFEKGFTESLARARKKCRDKLEIKKIELQVAKWKMKIANRKNDLPEKRDILLHDKFKAPKKGQTFQQMRKRIGNR